MSHAAQYFYIIYISNLYMFISQRLGSSHEGEHQKTIGDKSQASQELGPDTEKWVRRKYFFLFILCSLRRHNITQILHVIMYMSVL